MALITSSDPPRYCSLCGALLIYSRSPDTTQRFDIFTGVLVEQAGREILECPNDGLAFPLHGFWTKLQGQRFWNSR